MSFKTFWKSKGFKSWFCACIPVTAIALAIVLVLTCNVFLYQTINSVFGGERRVLKSGDPTRYQYYTADYKNKEEVFAAANEFNEQISEEGIVLLKNEDKMLPMSKDSKVTVFGKNSASLVLGGSGSNASSGGGVSKTIYDSLSAAGIDYNPEMKAFYENNSRSGDGRPASPDMNSTITGLTGFPTGETPVSKYDDKARSSWKEYNDVAIVVISRVGGEGFDLPRTMFWDGKGYMNWGGTELIPGARNKDDHYLQLDQNETDMLKLAAENFDNIIVVLNSPTSMELGFLDDPEHYAYSDKIKACLWIGTPGNTGIMALGRVLTGEVNPSGRTVDLYSRNFKNDPTWSNFGNNLADGGNQYMDESGKKRNAYFVNYSEGIYTGYRYYETRDFEEAKDGNEGWYEENVVYPFGYGLSYTNFEWKVTSSVTDGKITADGKIKFDVEVTNKGGVAGKDVVQLYYSAPYYEDKDLEKSHVVLGAFAKTEEIPAGETRTVSLEIDVRDMASYDYDDGNKNGFKGYELEHGDYTFYIASNSHDRSNAFTYNLEKDVTFPKDEKTETEITNLFDDVSDRITQYMSRKDFEGTFPKAPTDADRTLSESDLEALNAKYTDNASDPWYSDEMPEQSSTVLSRDDTEVKLYDLIGKSYDDGLWDTLLNQLTVSQMKTLIQTGNYHTEAIENIDKPKTIDPDGPMGYTLFMGDDAVYDTCYYASESLVGSTWNTELAERFGEMIGNESLIGDEKGDGRTYAGWYAPAVNLHRSPFSGRNFEYYSEDPVLSANMAVGVIKGAKSKGVYTYVKHFALNDQETNRDTNGIAVWANEQAMREIYFLPFEEAVKEGGTTAMMSSFNRIGFTWAGGNYNLLTRLLRDEWGFEGMVITDYNLQSYMDVDQMVRAGGDINLSQSKELKSYESATAVTAIRKAAKNILYTVANSNAMNGYGEGNVWGYAAPIWFITMWTVFAVIVAGFAVWGVLVTRKVIVGYREGVRNGTIIPEVRVRHKNPDYEMTVSSKVYLGSVSLVAVVALVLAITFMVQPPRMSSVPPASQSYIENIILTVNDEEIQNNTITLEVGQTQKLDYALVVHGTVDESVTFISGNNNIVSVDDQGVLTALSGGECAVTVMANADNSVYGKILVKVTDGSEEANKQPHTITVEGGTANLGEATKGATVYLTPEAKEGMKFIGWTFSTEVEFDGNMFVMPAEDVTVTANYEKLSYTLTLENATFADGSTSKTLLYGDPFPTDIVYSLTEEQFMYGWKNVESGDIVNPVMPAGNITIAPDIRDRGEALVMAKMGIDYGSGTTVDYNIADTEIDGNSAKQINIAKGAQLVRIRDGGVSGADKEKVYITILLRNDSQSDLTFRYEVEYNGAIWDTETITLKAGEWGTFGIVIQNLESSAKPYHRIVFDSPIEQDAKMSFCGFLMQ